MNQIDVTQLTPEIVKEFLAKMKTKDDLNDILEHAAQAKEKLIQEEKIKAFEGAKGKLNEAIELLSDYDVSEFEKFVGVKDLYKELLISPPTETKARSTSTSKPKKERRKPTPIVATIDDFGQVIMSGNKSKLNKIFNAMTTEELNACAVTHRKYNKDNNSWTVWHEALGDKPDWAYDEKYKVKDVFKAEDA